MQLQQKERFTKLFSELFPAELLVLAPYCYKFEQVELAIKQDKRVYTRQ
ncbi:uncharacterized protein METZ01_LOCUS267316 [marine metagenome]|uniref:Uncharacterized protein n=1 Tax=marine metagenome TaxID=408172 RepID=A0A382JT03_9ZZZZ